MQQLWVNTDCILTIRQLAMEASKVLSAEIRRKHVGRKTISTFNYDASSALQKVGNVI